MSRDAGGTNTLPAGNPVVSGTLIDTGWANPTMDDISNEITDSLSRTGKGGMLSQFKSIAGTEAAPGISFLDQLTMGLRRAASSDMRASINGVDRMRWISGQPQIWDVSSATWGDIASALSKPVFQGENPTITDVTTAAMITSDGVPTGNTHIEYGFNTIQVKGDETSVDKMFLQRLGGDISVGGVAVTGDTTTVTFNSNGLPFMTGTRDKTTLIKSDSLAATSLTVQWSNADASSLAEMGFTGSDFFFISTEKPGAGIVLQAKASGGADITCAVFEPDLGGTDIGGITSPIGIFASIADVDLSSSDMALQAGSAGAANTAIGNNKIQGRDNGVAADIIMQPEGGNVRFGNGVQRLNPPTVERVEGAANYQLQSSDQNTYIYRTGGVSTVEILAGLTTALGGPDQEFWISYPSTETDVLTFIGVVPIDAKPMYPGDVSIIKHIGSNTYQMIPIVETQNSNTTTITATRNIASTEVGGYIYRNGAGDFNLTVIAGLNVGRQQKGEIVIDNIDDVNAGTITIIQGAGTILRTSSGGSLVLAAGETGYLKAIAANIWLFHK